MAPFHYSRRSLAAVLAGTLLSAAAAAQARAAEEDWPNLRGPRYDAVSAETGLAESWPASGPPVLWRIELGAGYSSFAAADGRLYTMTQSRSGQYVVCLDANTGRELWRRRTNWPWNPDGDWPGPRATPAVHAGRVYFADAFGLAGCLDAADGRAIWSVNITGKFRGEGTEFGYSCSPLVMDDKVFLPVGGPGASVVALDAGDGATVWASGDEAASYSPAMPVRVDGRAQVVVCLRNVVAGFDPRTGARLWECRWSQGYDEHSAWPIYEEPYLLAASAFRQGARCLRLKAGEGGVSAQLVWESRELSNDVASSLVVRGHVYGFDLHELQPNGERPAQGLFKCIDLATGVVRWSTDRTGQATVITADGKLVLLNEAGELILARETPERYEELARARVLADGTCWTQPTLYRGRLYVRGESQAACVYLGTSRDVAAAAALPAAPESARRRADGFWRGDSLTSPTWADILRWFLFSIVGVFGISAILAGAARALGAATAARALFYAAAFALGIVGTFFLSRLAGDFVFTWPASLFVACQLALAAAEASKDAARSARYRSLVAAVAFMGLAVGYYVLCRETFVLAGFGFLTGLALAAPVEVVAARKAHAAMSLACDVIWTAVSFSVFFWASGLFIYWRTRL